ncbi:hypothetical protein FFK22_019275 [Mycobacterium sp. KBS0706]|uniref:helix-turn-helix transcriptional regulator n=1 Tax=Mycobacterium sp. KBS0706 TaxID=2578109 RepID=UPI00110FA6FB|nr:hypothetical protein [Mycobacterium sp. KBS0706]TSD87034.1 hypothetical protein FFK22_019275 [Mycobacterium sp. KBS0706]
MTKAVARPSILPRVLSAAQVAAYLGRSLTWFSEHRAELEAAGFPPPLPLIGGFDKRAIDQWLDRNSGMIPDNPAVEDYDDAWMRASHG